MIVKNESKIIERCLSSVAPYISTWVIHDTGSTDDTPEKIRAFFTAKKIPGVLTTIEFKDFEFNRNAALRAAVQQPGIDYVLFIDADMELQVNDKDQFLNCLQSPAYRICQLSGTLSYYNTRLVGRVIFDTVKYVGVTHEYVCTGSVENNNLPNAIAFMKDSGDGGCKADKFIRDERLLTGDLLVNPNNPRSRFYLAQTFNHQGKNDEAIQQYKLYLKNPGFEEEAWYAQYMLSLMFKNKGDDANCLLEGMKAYERRPHRAEPLLKMAEHCRSKGWNHMSWMYAKTGLSVSFPSNDSLFVEVPVYDFLLLFELSITAYYVGQAAAGLKIINNVLLTHAKRHGVSGWHLDCMKKNLSFYMRPLPSCTHQQLFASETGPGWNYFNPSIAVFEGQLQMNLRCCNYVMTKDMVYSINPGYSTNPTPSYENPIKTRNMRCVWDQGQVLPCNEFFVPDVAHEHFPALIQGYEDLRVFTFRGELWYTATTRGLCATELNTICVGTKDRLFLLPSPVKGRCEKNWLGFEHRGKLLLVYQFSPFTVLQMNPDTGSYVTYLEVDLAYDASSFRGGSSPCRVANGYYLIVHEVLPHYSGPRKYMHRILFMTDDLEITHVSVPFVLKGEQLIEYVSGLVIRDGTVYITWGEMDAKAYLTTMPLPEFEAFCRADGPIDEMSLLVTLD